MLQDWSLQLSATLRRLHKAHTRFAIHPRSPRNDVPGPRLILDLDLDLESARVSLRILRRDHGSYFSHAAMAVDLVTASRASVVSLRTASPPGKYRADPRQSLQA